MMRLKLFQVQDKTILEVLRRMDFFKELMSEGCFWIGAVPRGDQLRLDRFLSAAGQGDIRELSAQNYIGDDLVYALLVQNPHEGNEFHIVLLDSPASLESDPKILVAKKLSEPCLVEAKDSTTLPAHLSVEPKAEFWKTFFRELIRIK